jgi:hypothetical protein
VGKVAICCAEAQIALLRWRSIRSLTLGCFASPVGWCRYCIDCLAYSGDSKATNAVFILHIFAATGEDGRKACLAWRKGLQTHQEADGPQHRQRERSRLTQLYVKTNRWHVLLESGRQSSPPSCAISRGGASRGTGK